MHIQDERSDIALLDPQCETVFQEEDVLRIEQWNKERVRTAGSKIVNAKARSKLKNQFKAAGIRDSTSQHLSLGLNLKQ